MRSSPFLEIFIQMQETVKSLGVLIHRYIALTGAADLKLLLIEKLKSLRSKSVYIDTINIFLYLCEDVFYFSKYLYLTVLFLQKGKIGNFLKRQIRKKNENK